MAIKTDATARRWVEMEFIAPGRVDDVWAALATGDGNAAWFVKATIEPRVGGAMTLDFGTGDISKAEVISWQPPMVFGYVERNWSPGAPPLETEVIVTPRAAGKCLVRMTHSVFTKSAAWDEQLEHFESGWVSFFVVLRGYLTHFKGRKASSFMATALSKDGQADAWGRFVVAFGAGDLSVGARVESATTPEQLSGVVEHVFQDAQQRYVLIRLDEGFAQFSTFEKDDGSVNVGVCRHCYGDDAEALCRDSDTKWRTWLTNTF